MKTMSPRIAAEAAVWIARLHGPDRSPQLERECLAWQAISPQHRLAFERCTDTWLDAAGLQQVPPASPKATAQPARVKVVVASVMQLLAAYLGSVLRRRRAHHAPG